MEVQVIGLSEYSVYISGEELSRRALSPETVTAREAMALVGEVIGPAMPVPARLELFPGRHELLIFVHGCAGRLRFFRFESSEPLITAAIEGAFTDPATLYFYKNAYILALWQPDAADNAGVPEFGDELRCPEGFLHHLAEHGQALSEGFAASTLRSSFGR